MTSAQRTSGHPRQDKPLATATARLKERREKREEDAAQVELEAVRRELEEERKRAHQLLVDEGGSSWANKVLQKEVGELRAKVNEFVATLLTANAERDEFADLLDMAQAKEAEHERRKETLHRLEQELERARQETVAAKQIVALKEDTIRALKSPVEAKQRAKQEVKRRLRQEEERAKLLEKVVAEAKDKQKQLEPRIKEMEAAGAERALLRDRLRASEEREKRLVKERDELARQLQVVRSKLEQEVSNGKNQEQEQIKESANLAKQQQSDVFDGPKALLAATDGKLGTSEIEQLKRDFVIANRYLVRHYHLLDALALGDRDVTNLLLAPETVRHCIAELPAKSLVDFVKKSAKSRLPISPNAEDRARQYCRLLRRAERDLETAKQRLANRTPNPVQGRDGMESREDVNRLQAAISQNDEISELTRDFEDHLKRVEAQVDDLKERLEQATAELELARMGATGSNKTTESGDEVAFPISSSFPFGDAAATLDHVGTLLPRLAQIIEKLEEENEDLREDAAFLMARQALQA
ncbi:hypothetical protein JCM10296v2_000518 [Rhodotorula toruloides]